MEIHQQMRFDNMDIQWMDVELSMQPAKKRYSERNPAFRCLDATLPFHISLHSFRLSGYSCAVNTLLNPLTSALPTEVSLPSAPLVRVVAQVRFPQMLSIEKKDFVAPLSRGDS